MPGEGKVKQDKIKQGSGGQARSVKIEARQGNAGKRETRQGIA